MRVCSKCRDTKTPAEFGKHAKGRDGLRAACKACHGAQSRAWAQENKARRKLIDKRYRETNKEQKAASTRASHLRTAYGIDSAQYDVLFTTQGGACAICKKAATKHLSVDHNHDTDAVRALLCSPCNTAIGLLREDPFLMRSAAAYIESHK